MTRRFLFLLPLAALALPGCSYTCHFEGRVTVRDAATGQPVPNAQLRLLDADGGPIAFNVSGAGQDATVRATDPKGECRFRFGRVPTPAHQETGWKLVVSAPGFEPETVEVGPVQTPKGDKETAYLFFYVTMRKAAP